jgi:Fic family protein
MFKPTYRITPFFISCLEKISSQKVFIDQIGKKSPLKISAARDSFNRSVHSSTWIEGNSLSLAQVAALSADKDIVAQEKQKLEVKNCIKALRWILKHKGSALSEEKLLKLHGMMTKGLLQQERCGRYRNIQNYIVNAKGQTIFTPISPSKVKQGMKDLFVWLKQQHREHPMIRCAIFHHEFVSIHPFVDGNGRVARAASQWILIADHYDPLWTLGLDEYFAQDRSKYYDMIQQAREMDGDYTYWIEYIAKGLLEAIQHVSNRIKEETRKYKQIALTPKQNELLNLLEENGILGSAEICKRMKINRARVNQLIGPLVKAGIVMKEGTTRAVKYSLK